MFQQIEVPAIRGNILSYDGKTLATSVPYYQVRIDCTVANDSLFNLYIDSLSYQLSNFFKDKSKERYKSLIVEGRKSGKRYLALGNRRVDYAELAKIKEFALFRLGANKGGIIAEEKYVRKHPYGQKAYRTIGFINSLGEGTGIESSHDHYLKGESGRQIRQKREGGEWVPINGDQNILPQDGYDIRTTINIDFQEAAEDALREQITKGGNVEGGTAVVMETKTGAIRAIANLMTNHHGGFEERLNYAVGQATEPGSVLKLVTLVALLEDNKITLDTPIDCGGGSWEYMGQRVSDSHSVGLQNVKGAFAHSSNVGFAKLCTNAYRDNIERYTERLNDLKIGEKMNLDIQGEGIATIHSVSYIKEHPGILASMGFGYGMTLTPLHTLTFYNAIANNGKMMKPYFIESYEKEGKVVKQFGPTVISGSICSKETAKKAQEALRAVVTDGTGKFIKNAKYSVSGKTGTARILLSNGRYDRNGLRKYQATFCGFFPSENPIYTIIVILYSGETAGSFYGASKAGPAFNVISDFIYANSPQMRNPLVGKKEEGVNTNPSISAGVEKETALVINNLPIENKQVKIASKSHSNREEKSDGLKNVIGMGLKDAVYFLESQGVKVKIEGKGRVVAQHPEAGSPFKSKEIVKITLSDKQSNIATNVEKGDSKEQEVEGQQGEVHEVEIEQVEVQQDKAKAKSEPNNQRTN